jgi:hypothetical protein
MKMYCFAGWRQASDGEGLEADLPENIGYWVLAEPRGTECALVECDLSWEVYDQFKENRVSDNLADLLESARQYAPALALLRKDARRKDFDNPAAFEDHLIESLQKHLGEQRQHPYFLALALVSEGAYKSAGTYYWIVGYRPERVGHEVSWVSHDFYVYQDSITEFTVESADLELRFK